MANTFLTPSIIARAALATLYSNTVMAALVHRDFDADFNGKVGDTITIRKPAVFTANEYVRANGLTIQSATEGSTTVTLDKLLDVSFEVTTEQMALEINDFQQQLLVPAMEAINQKIDTLLLGLRSDVVAVVGPPSGGAGTTVDPSDPKLLIDARTTLSKAKVPTTQRSAVLAPETAGEFLKDPLFNRVDESGATEGLREASLGSRKFGFDPYESQNITDKKSVCFHRTAFALVSRVLPLPMGAAPRSAIAAYKGFGLRVVFDYDIDKKQDVVSIDTLVGVKTLDANRAVVIEPTVTA